MDHFEYKGGQLFAEGVAVAEIAQQYGTPCYVYSRATLERHWHAFNDAFNDHPHLICFAVKANSNLGVLNVLARMGSGFDIVSVGELQRVLAAGGDPKKMVFSGVGKRPDEMRRALEVGIHCFNVESEAELQLLNQVALECGTKAPVSLRVNPDVDAGTHPYISTGLRENKFGVPVGEAKRLYHEAKQLAGIELAGIDCHIGSQLTELTPFLDALERILALIDELAADGIKLRHIDLGGGLGVSYTDEQPPLPHNYAEAVRDHITARDLEVILEPGRAIAANAGILLTRVEYLKPTEEKDFAIVDAAMNDLLRPSLYSAIQQIIPADQNAQGRDGPYDIVGPVCETGDFLGKSRSLSLAAGDLLAVRSSGAYGFTMSSNYNSRPRAAEVMVDGDQVHLVRERETIESLFAGERTLP
ncbi:diaminopimelate decarboxylase [Solemya elarraichensis gill symbiont]|uniref:Diaminopimelate decarboxylase n=1 Tax=Solemya elarraichensis gill symbiont TaxID=1918949 RepID=A0A1T2KZN1_9GAMM|nr:diaminopimelate decarboxylase [Solemya elarraichensis gill symbiont]OOZ38176.1 diaminopimelate decarboxylase [Solemya elarraichensis gill symbiont]